MRAELVDGRVVELAQDCDCLTHDGPHWLHMDALAREMHAEMTLNAPARGAQLGLLLARVAGLEAERLREKARWMAQHGIVRLIDDDNA